MLACVSAISSAKAAGWTAQLKFSAVIMAAAVSSERQQYCLYNWLAEAADEPWHLSAAQLLRRQLVLRFSLFLSLTSLFLVVI